MPAAPRSTGVAPGPLLYAAIDGTDAVDSATFGALLEKQYGWRNLLANRLEPAPPVPDEPKRLIDEAHPFLPIYAVPAKGREVAVVCPNGIGGHGRDAFWRTHGDSHRTGSRTLVGRHAAAARAARLMNEFILTPELRYTIDARRKTRYHLADPGAPEPGSSDASACLLYLSSHGWLGGYMSGNEIHPWQAAEPPEARPRFLTRPYFVVGRAAAQGRGFHGPRWIVLAQCSTLNSATWPLWARVLSKSDPHVRGILAYEEASPGAGPSARIAEEFLARLKDMPILHAWRTANTSRGIKWAAIVHKDAKHDRLKDFQTFHPFKDVSTTATRFNYLGYVTSKPAGQPILDVPEPFQLRLEAVNLGNTEEILPENLDSRRPRLERAREFLVTVVAPPGEELQRVRHTLVHIRSSHPEQFPWAQIFPLILHAPEVKIAGQQSRDLEVSCSKPTNELTVKVKASLDVAGTGLAQNHSYLWLRVRAWLASGKTLNHDFKTKGFIY